MQQNKLFIHSIFFLGLFFIPSILNALFKTESIGTYIVLSAIVGVMFSIFSGEKIKFNYSYIILLILIFLWSMLTLITTPYEFSEDRFILAFFSLSVFMYFSLIIEESFVGLHENYISLLVRKVFFGMILVSVVSLTLSKSSLRVLELNFFPFSEPSHLARLYGVFLCLNMVINNSFKRKVILLIITLIFSVLFPSLSLFIYNLLAFLLLVFVGKGSKVITRIPLLFMAAVCAAVILNVLGDGDYYLERITFVENTDNLTALVFWQGVEATKNILSETKYIGIGLHQLGNEPGNYVKSLIAGIRGGLGDIADLDLNRRDGGFVAAKVISEFGIFGLAGILFYMKIAANCLRKLKLKMHTTHANIAMTVIVAVAPEILLRGGGYFSVSLLLMLASIRYLINSSKSNKLFKY